MTHFWKCRCLAPLNFAEHGERTLSVGETIDFLLSLARRSIFGLGMKGGSRTLQAHGLQLLADLSSGGQLGGLTPLAGLTLSARYRK